MAIREPLDILQEGVNVWNTWKAQCREETIDLSSARLSGVSLDGVHLNKVNLTHADLSSAILSNAILLDTDFTHADLTHADLSSATLIRADLTNANLTHADLTNAYLSTATLNNALLADANLSGANLFTAYLLGTNFTNANLTNANLTRSTLVNADLTNADLTCIDFTGADLTSTNLSGANLTYANLTYANLSGANLSGANLTMTNLNTVNLTNSDLSNARTAFTNFSDIDLRLVRGLKTIKHYGPSTIGTNTLERSKGDIPEIFLRNAGLSETSITYTHSLTQSSTKYYTCFISYSSKDEEFAERLHADLRQKGIQCWFAPDDLKIGEEFPTRIEEAIRFYDKLLVILSEHSVKSSWVEDEVRAALEKEEQSKREQQRKTVLFPIKIDNVIEQDHSQWVAMMRRKRHIGDFSYWKDYGSYMKAFNRLLRDLKADSAKDAQ